MFKARVGPSAIGGEVDAQKCRKNSFAAVWQDTICLNRFSGMSSIKHVVVIKQSTGK